jgi:uncharacterized protein with NRDE domain
MKLNLIKAIRNQDSLYILKYIKRGGKYDGFNLYAY